MGNFADKLDTLIEESRDESIQTIVNVLEQKLNTLRVEDDEDEAAEAAEDETGSEEPQAGNAPSSQD